MTPFRFIGPIFMVSILVAQEPGTAELANLRQAASDANPRPVAPGKTETLEATLKRESDQERQQKEIVAAKAREKGPKRFAQDLFSYRQAPVSTTEGGISDDYVLGAGDQVQVNLFGSATFEAPLQVDGRGELVVPKVGTVRVAGMSLAKARAAVAAKVGQVFSRTTVDLSILKLREVRVFVLGEVYLPGSYMVPSLSSLVNVLGLAGGPTAAGSFRQVRVLRGGAVVHQVDLYPLRAEGVGNMNFGLQSGDTIFVPLAFNQVMLEGAFTRVVAATGDLAPRERTDHESPEILALKAEIRMTEAKLGLGSPANATPAKEAGPAPLKPDEREGLEEELAAARVRLRDLQRHDRGDKRLPENLDRDHYPEGIHPDNTGVPGWLARWQDDGQTPTLQFEFLPGETAQDALRFAGGLALQAFTENLSLRRSGPGGVVDVLDIPLPRAGSFELRKGDVLSALSSRERVDRLVTMAGWVRVPGAYARTEGLRVGELLRREAQVLPDTYLHRGEIIRTLPDTTTRYLAFDVAKALAGQPDHNVLLENRDRIELYRTNDLRLPRTVSVVGPFTRAGTFPYHEGMRASDLLFQAGVPLREADHFVAELAHTRGGNASEVTRLDLGKLLTTEDASPVQLKDDAVNPRLEPLDQLSVYSRPDYRAHRTVTLMGQVMRPGSYALDGDQVSLRDVLKRAGGLSHEAMPQATIFIRPLVATNPVDLEGLDAKTPKAKDPTSNGINSILERLSETKRQPTTGNLLNSPVLHGLGTGNLNRMIVNVPGILAGDHKLDVDLQDGDQIIIPRRTEAAYVVGETASPFMSYKISGTLKVRDMLKLAGGVTRNADETEIRLLKADGRILDRAVLGQEMEPGDAVLVPQRIRRDYSWQENLAALTPLALILNVVK